MSPRRRPTTARTPALAFFWALISQGTLGTSLKLPKSESPIPKTWTAGPLRLRGSSARSPPCDHCCPVTPAPGLASQGPTAGKVGALDKRPGFSGERGQAGPPAPDKALGAPSKLRGERPQQQLLVTSTPSSTPSTFLGGVGPCVLPASPPLLLPGNAVTPRPSPAPRPSTHRPASCAHTHEGATGDGLAGADRGQHAASGGHRPIDGHGRDWDRDPQVGARGQPPNWCPLPRPEQKAAVRQGPVSATTPATWAVTTRPLPRASADT